MKALVVLFLFVPVLAFAQPSGSGSAGSAPAPSPGSAADPAPPPETPPMAGSQANADAAGLRKICSDAMNADESFAKAIVEVADKNAAEKRLQLDLAQHETAAKAIAKNQRHVILAYAAMWLVAVGFVLFLWRRQQMLKTEIAQLKADLDAATKDGK